MKRLLLLVITLMALKLNAQNCKFRVNGIDKFTGKFTKITNPEKMIATFYTEGDFSIKRIDTSYTFIFDYALSSYSDFDPYSINQGAELIFLLENGKTITLNSTDNIRGTKQIVRGLPAVYTCYLTNVSYPVTKQQIDEFLISKVKSIRFYRNESNGKEDYIDNNIKKKNQDDLQNLVKCVL